MNSSNSRSLRKAISRALVGGSVLVPLWLYSSMASAQSAQPPNVDAGEDRTIADSDGVPGETVVLEGFAQSRNVSSEDTLTVLWFDGEEQIAAERQPTVRLADGVHQLRLVATDNCCESSSALTATSMVTITIQAAARPPIAHAGADRSIVDSDGQPGERVTLDASGSSAPDGTITSYTWYQGDTVLGTGQVLTNVALPDGQNTITLVVTDDRQNTASDTVVIAVGEPAPPPRPTLSEIALTPEQKAVARTLDDLCSRFEVTPSEEAGVVAGAAAEIDVADLAARCAGILSDPSAANQRAALDELGAQEFNAMRTPTVVFSQSQFQAVMDRLVALRSGARGAALAGMNVRIGDKLVSLEDVADSLRHALGGGASSDGESDLLEERLGLWMRGNYGVGEKSRTAAGIGFESDQWGVSGGADYRFGSAAIAGVSIGYGKSSIDFDPTSQGGIDTRSLAGSIYGSSYFGGLYIDGVINYIDSDYDSTRRISYFEGTTTIDRSALGSTGGDTISGGAAIGYDFTFGAFTLAPTLGYYYLETSIDSFAERNAGGLNLVFDEQSYTSSAANAGLRASFAWKTSWGVFIPHFRGAFVRELEDSAEVFGVRFASDPFADAANPSPPILIESDRIDRSYLRLAAGASAQFAFGIAGYFEYQRLEGYEQVKFEDFTIGLRLQRQF